PDAAKAMIMEAGEREAAQENMAALFDDPVLLGIIELVEPAHASFIVRYAQNLQLLKKEKNIVQAENSEFRKSIWQFILAFLFMERGSLFNTKMFLESHIRRMALHYHLRFEELLIFFVQAIGENMVSGENNLLFRLLTEMLQGLRKNGKVAGGRHGDEIFERSVNQERAWNEKTGRHEIGPGAIEIADEGTDWASLIQGLTSASVSREELTGEMLHLLSCYLEAGRLPELYAGKVFTEAEIIIDEVLRWLDREQVTAWRAVLENTVGPF